MSTLNVNCTCSVMFSGVLHYMFISPKHFGSRWHSLHFALCCIFFIFPSLHIPLLWFRLLSETTVYPPSHSFLKPISFPKRISQIQKAILAICIRTSNRTPSPAKWSSVSAGHFGHLHSCIRSAFDPTAIQASVHREQFHSKPIQTQRYVSTFELIVVYSMYYNLSFNHLFLSLVLCAFYIST